MMFSKESCFFVVFKSCRKTNRKKKTQDGKGPQKPNNKVFLRWSSKMRKKTKKWIFCKHCLNLFVSGREKKRHFCAHYLFWPKTFWAKTAQTTRNCKNSGFNGNCRIPKMTPFYQKVFFGMGEKVAFTNCVLKSCVLLKTQF